VFRRTSPSLVCECLRPRPSAAAGGPPWAFELKRWLGGSEHWRAHVLTRAAAQAAALSYVLCLSDACVLSSSQTIKVPARLSLYIRQAQVEAVHGWWGMLSVVPAL
jgi:hypothetical protein